MINQIANKRMPTNRSVSVNKPKNIVFNNNGKNNPRPDSRFITKLNGKFHTINLPEVGSFNGGIARYDKDKIICVYRRNEQSFSGCHLNNQYEMIDGSHFEFSMYRCTDPKLIWRDKELLIIYSSIHNVHDSQEYMCGSVALSYETGGRFSNNEEFRISTPDLHGRQKNWMPFNHDGNIYLIASVCPHIVYQLVDNNKCIKVYENDWSHPWMIGTQLRGNTNAVRIDDTSYLATFHTAMWHNNKYYYDNGFYLFSSAPPFKVMRCASRTYLPAEAACSNYFRKHNQIVCNFPVGMMVENDNVIISYGDNDSNLKIVEYKLSDVLRTMVKV